MPGLGAPFTSFSPPGGYEGAVGFDYRWAQDPFWYFIFDFRYGGSRSRTASSGATSSSSSRTFITNGRHGGGFNTLLTTTINKSTSNSSNTQSSERESHLVLDFMAGRDVGLGASSGKIEFGIRFADLQAQAQAGQATNSATNILTTRTFYSPSHFPVPARVLTTNSSSSSSSSSSFAGTWNSRFFGAGPRVAFTGSVPLGGFWSFDYLGGVAGLVGNRSLNFNVGGTAPGVNFSTDPIVFVFNADGWIALTYAFTPNAKISGGLRADFYDEALTTINTTTGGLQGIDRLYWGYFVRLTGSL